MLFEVYITDDMRRLISFGSQFEAQGGYSRAVVDGEWVSSPARPASITPR